jgi:hypothetical protein
MFICGPDIRGFLWSTITLFWVLTARNLRIFGCCIGGGLLLFHQWEFRFWWLICVGHNHIRDKTFLRSWKIMWQIAVKNNHCLNHWWEISFRYFLLNLKFYLHFFFINMVKWGEEMSGMQDFTSFLVSSWKMFNSLHFSVATHFKYFSWTSPLYLKDHTSLQER